MVECAFVLAVDRLSAIQCFCQQREMPNVDQVFSIPRENCSCPRNGNDDLDVATNVICEPMTSNQINGFRAVSAHCRAAEVEAGKIRNLENPKIDESFTWKHFISSPNTIDIMALVLFPVSYIVFNVFYWAIIM